MNSIFEALSIVQSDSTADGTGFKDPSCKVMCGVMRKLFCQSKPTRLLVDGLDECNAPVKAEWKD